MAYRKTAAYVAKRGRKSVYIHLLRAMRAGEVLYFPDQTGRLDRAIAASVYRGGGKAETAGFVATNLDPATAHRIVRVKMLKPMGA